MTQQRPLFFDTGWDKYWDRRKRNEKDKFIFDGCSDGGYAGWMWTEYGERGAWAEWGTGRKRAGGDGFRGTGICRGRGGSRGSERGSAGKEDDVYYLYHTAAVRLHQYGKYREDVPGRGESKLFNGYSVYCRQAGLSAEDQNIGGQQRDAGYVQSGYGSLCDQASGPGDRNGSEWDDG